MVNDGFEVAAITEFRQCHLQSIEAIEQVGTEAPIGNGLIEASVGSGDQEDIDLGSDAANGAHRPVVKQAQKHGLQRDGHVADLVKEQRAGLSLLDESDCATAPRAGERAVNVTEQLGLYQAFGKGGAIDGDEGAGPPAGGMWRASCSLPVPVSPRMRIGILRADAVSTCRTMARTVGSRATKPEVALPIS